MSFKLIDEGVLDFLNKEITDPAKIEQICKQIEYNIASSVVAGGIDSEFVQKCLDICTEYQEKLADQ